MKGGTPTVHLWRPLCWFSLELLHLVRRIARLGDAWQPFWGSPKGPRKGSPFGGGNAPLSPRCRAAIGKTGYSTIIIGWRTGGRRLSPAIGRRAGRALRSAFRATPSVAASTRGALERDHWLPRAMSSAAGVHAVRSRVSPRRSVNCRSGGRLHHRRASDNLRALVSPLCDAPKWAQCSTLVATYWPRAAHGDLNERLRET